MYTLPLYYSVPGNSLFVCFLLMQQTRASAKAWLRERRSDWENARGGRRERGRGREGVTVRGGGTQTLGNLSFRVPVERLGIKEGEGAGKAQVW